MRSGSAGRPRQASGRSSAAAWHAASLASGWGTKIAGKSLKKRVWTNCASPAKAARLSSCASPSRIRRCIPSLSGRSIPSICRKILLPWKRDLLRRMSMRRPRAAGSGGPYSRSNRLISLHSLFQRHSDKSRGCLVKVSPCS